MIPASENPAELLEALRAEQRGEICRTCGLLVDTEHELRVVGPIEAGYSERRASDALLAMAAMAFRVGQFAHMPQDFLAHEIDVLGARIAHFKAASGIESITWVPWPERVRGRDVA